MNSKINYDILIKEDNSYGYAKAKTTNNVGTNRLVQKTVDAIGLQLSPVVVRAVLACAMDVARDEVASGNRVYFPSNYGNAVAFYPIIDDSTIRQGDTDGEGNVIPMTPESFLNRSGQWKVRMGAQISTDFGLITKNSHLHYSGKVKQVKVNDTTQQGGNQGGDNNGGGGSGPDENVLG